MDLSLWQDIQDYLADITGLPLAIYDQKGNLLSSVSGESRLINGVSESSKGKRLFRDFYRESIVKAFQASGPVILKSPLNQHLFVVPLTLDEDNKGAIIGGHSFFTSRDFSDFTKLAESYGITLQHLSAIAKDIKFNDFKVLSAVSRFVELNANFMIKNLRSQEKLSKDLYRYKTLLEIITNLSPRPLDKKVFQEIFHTLTLLFDVETCSLMIREKKEFFRTLWAVGRDREKIKNSVINVSESTIQEAVNNGKFLYLTNSYHIPKIGFTKDIKIVGIFPLVKNRKTFALLNIFNTSMGDEDKRLIQVLCKHLSNNFEYGALKSKLIKKKKDFRMLREMNKILSSVKDTKELHKIIIDKSTELLNAEKGSLMLSNSNGNELVIKAIKGINEKLVKHLKVKPGEGVAGKVFKSSSPALVRDIEEDQRFKKRNRPHYSTKSFISVPLKLNSRTIGVLNISDKVSGEFFSEYDLNLLLSFSCCVSTVIERANFSVRSKELIKMSMTDPLTGLWNRRFLQERLTEEIERSKRYGSQFSFLMMDIDNFKRINDSRGHQAGDGALKIISKVIRDAVRAIDIIFRYGGEEFSAILPLADKEGASVIAERIRQEVEKTIFPQTEELPDIKLTMSIGLASFPQDELDPNELIKKADESLYFAKAEGKNKVAIYDKEKFEYGD